ncbi:MAG TPA: DNA mismatch repair protein MutL, partial [Tissierellia bacterium]|nr:DNA mismatch repair protein MutL [Tissierellia bacterium]
AKNIMEDIPSMNKGDRLLPQEGIRVLIDREYIMASLGVLSMEYPEAALRLLENTLDI